jgi:hypothetical protein
MAFFKKSLGMVKNLILVKLFAAVEPGFPLNDWCLSQDNTGGTMSTMASHSPNQVTNGEKVW